MQESSIFLKAVECQDRADRAELVERECRGDQELKRRVEQLLAAHDSAGGILDQIGAMPTTDRRLPPSEDVGAVIGPYKLLQRIGEGGMGTVYMADQERPVRRRVALKIIKSGMDTRQVIARFEAERQALALMDHNHIARVFDAGTTDSGRPFFVMELVRGIPITQYCDENKLTVSERLQLFVPVCQAIQHAHQKGIIHRDIKPSNVMVALYDGHPVPKVIDFGIAKATQHALTERTLFTEFGQILGTFEYMSPEQAESNQLDIDTRSDVYSLGVLLYELLTGSTPLTREELRQAGLGELLRCIREREPPKPSTRLSESHHTLASISATRRSEPSRLTQLVRGDLDCIVMKALDKDRGRRYPTAADFATDVLHYLHDEPVLATPPSLTYQFRKFARRHRAIMASAAVILTALLAGLVAATYGLRVANRERVQADTARRSAEQARDAQNQARQAAEAARQMADANRTKAEQSQRQTSQLLSDQLASQGSQLMAQGEFGEALSWFVESLRHDSPERDDLNRRRIGALLQLCTKPELVWDFPAGLRGTHEDRIAYSTDGSMLLTLANDGLNTSRLIAWDVSSGNQVWQHTGQSSGQVEKFKFTANGKLLAVDCGESVQILTSASGLPITPPISCVGRDFHDEVEFSPDSLYLAVIRPGGEGNPGGARTGTVAIWDLSTGREMLPTVGPTEAVAVRFALDGKRLVVIWEKPTNCDYFQIFELPSGKPLGEPICANIYAYGPDRRLMTITKWMADQEVYQAELVDLETAKPVGLPVTIGRWYAPAGAGTSELKPTKDGQKVLFIDGRVEVEGNLFRPIGLRARMIDLMTGQAVTLGPEIAGEQHEIDDAMLIGDGSKALLVKQALAPGADTHLPRRLEIVDSTTGQSAGPTIDLPGRVLTTHVTPRGDRAVLELDQGARIWDLNSGLALTPDLRTSASRLGDADICALSPDGEYAAIGLDQHLRVYRTSNGRLLGTVRQQPQTFLRFSPDSQRLLSADLATARQWSLKSMDSPFHALPLRQSPYAMQLSPEGTRLVTATAPVVDEKTNQIYPGDLQLWDVTKDLPLMAAVPHDSDVLNAEFSRDGRQLVTWQRQEFQLRDAQTCRPLGPPIKPDGFARAAWFAADGRKLATCAEKLEGSRLLYNLELWDISDASQPVHRLKMTDATELVAVFSLDSRRLLVTSHVDSPAQVVARLWNAETGESSSGIVNFNADSLSGYSSALRRFAAFTGDGRFVAIRTAANELTVLNADTGQPTGSPVRFDGCIVDLVPQPTRKDLLLVALAGDQADTVRTVDPSTGAIIETIYLAKGQQFLNYESRYLPWPLSLQVEGFRAQLLDLNTGQPYGRPLIHPDLIEEQVVRKSSLNGKFILLTSGGRTTGTPVFDARSANPLLNLRIGAAGQTASSIYRSAHELRIWDATTGHLYLPPLTTQTVFLSRSPTGRNQQPFDIAQDGSVLAWTDGEGTARVWNIPREDRDVDQLAAYVQGLTGYAYDPSGTVTPRTGVEWVNLRKKLGLAAQSATVNPYPPTQWGVGSAMPQPTAPSPPEATQHEIGRLFLEVETYESMELFPEAIDAAKRILQMDLDSDQRHRALVDLYTLHYNIGQIEQATEYLLEAVKLPGQAEKVLDLIDDDSHRRVKRPLAHHAWSQPTSWKYTFTEPPVNWMQPSFDDTGWLTGPAPFGGPNSVYRKPTRLISTLWTDSDIWMRREFQLPNQLPPGALVWRICHASDCEIYLNGLLAATGKGSSGNEYVTLNCLADAAATLKPGGKNWLAIHCRNAAGAQHIDAGLYAQERDCASYLKVVDAAVAAAEDNVRIRHLRANTLARLGRWADAIADLEYLLKLAPEHPAEFQLAALLAQTGNWPAYRQHCQLLLNKYGGTTDPDKALNTSIACLLAPPDDSGLTADELASAASLATSADRESTQGRPLDDSFGRALAAFRQGDFRASIELLATGPIDESPATNPLGAARRALQALAQSGLSLTAESLQTAREAAEALKRLDEFAELTGDDVWQQQLIARLMLQQITQLSPESMPR